MTCRLHSDNISYLNYSNHFNIVRYLLTYLLDA